jgi:hypothetical protein
LEVGAQVGPKLGSFALHLADQPPLLVGGSSGPFQIVTQPTNPLEPLSELGAFVEGFLVTHGGSIALPP